jgi:hypothetical protein
MGWDDWTSKFKFECKPDTDEKDVGLKEFEVEEDIIFTVKYKVLAKDKSDLIDKKVKLTTITLKIGEQKIRKKQKQVEQLSKSMEKMMKAKKIRKILKLY